MLLTIALMCLVASPERSARPDGDVIIVAGKPLSGDDSGFADAAAAEFSAAFERWRQLYEGARAQLKEANRKSEMHGLSAEVSADDVARLDLALQAQGVRVLVAAQDATAALQLLDDGGDDAEGAGAPPLNRFQRWIVRYLGGHG